MNQEHIIEKKALCPNNVIEKNFESTHIPYTVSEESTNNNKFLNKESISMEHTFFHIKENNNAFMDVNNNGIIMTEYNSNHLHFPNEMNAQYKTIENSFIMNQTQPLVCQEHAQQFIENTSLYPFPNTSNAHPFLSNVGYFPILPIIPHLMNSNLNINRDFLRNWIPTFPMSNLCIPNLLYANMYNPFTPFNTNNGFPNFSFPNQSFVDCSNGNALVLPSTGNETRTMKNTKETETQNNTHTSAEQFYKEEEQNNHRNFHVDATKEERKQEDSSNYFHRICPYLLKGICNRGRHCRFIHPVEKNTKKEIGLAQDTFLCKEIKKEKESKDYHTKESIVKPNYKSKEEFQREADSTYKTRMCIYFLLNGSCRLGDTCRFAHGEHELRIKMKKKRNNTKKKKKKNKAQPTPNIEAQNEVYNQKQPSNNTHGKEGQWNQKVKVQYKKGLMEIQNHKWNLQKQDQKNNQDNFVREKKQYIQNKIKNGLRKQTYRHYYINQKYQNWNYKEKDVYWKNKNSWSRRDVHSLMKVHKEEIQKNRERMVRKESKQIVSSKTEYSSSDTHTSMKCTLGNFEKYEKINYRNLINPNNIMHNTTGSGSTNYDRGSSNHSDCQIKNNISFNHQVHKTSGPNVCTCHYCKHKSRNNHPFYNGFHRITPFEPVIKSGRRNDSHDNKRNHGILKQWNCRNNEKMVQNNIRTSLRNKINLPLSSTYGIIHRFPLESYYTPFVFTNQRNAKNVLNS